MQTTAAIELQKIHAYYGHHRVLEDLTLSIPKGIIQGIIGPSGSGKTTLIKIINGLVKSRKGRVKTFTKKPHIGYIPQHMGLVKILTARENVLMGSLARVGTLRSIFKLFPKKEIQEADHLLEILELKSKADTPVYKLSGGEKRRVAIARALMQKPKILLADEMLSDLDFVKAKFIMEKIKSLKKEFDLTVVIIEHNLCLAKEFCDKIAILKNGKITENINKKTLNQKNFCKLFR